MSPTEVLEQIRKELDKIEEAVGAIRNLITPKDENIAPVRGGLQ